MHLRLCWVVCLLLALPASAAAPPRASLPDGARLRVGAPRMRLGSFRPEKMSRPPLFSRDRRLIAYEGVEAIQLYETKAGRRRWHPKTEYGTLYPMAFSQDGQQIVATCSANRAWIVDVNADNRCRPLNEERIFANARIPFCAAFLPGDRQLATWNNKHLTIWDVATGKQVRQTRREAVEANGSFSPDGRWFAFQARHDALTLTDVVKGKSRAIRFRDQKAPECQPQWSWSEDGRYLAISVTEPGVVSIYRTATGKQVKRFAFPDPSNFDNELLTSFSPDARVLAVHVGRKIRLVEIDTTKVLGEFDTNLSIGQELTTMTFRDADHLLLVDGHGFVWTWNVKTRKRVDPAEGHTGEIHSLAFSHDGETLVSDSGDYAIRRWDTRTGRMKSIWQDWELRGGGLSISAKADRAVLSGAGLGGGAVIDLKRNRVLWMPTSSQPGSNAFPEDFLISPDGSRVAMPYQEGDFPDTRHFVEVSRATDGNLIRRLRLRQHGPVAFTPEGDWLAAASSRPKAAEVELIDLHAGLVRQTLKATPTPGNDERRQLAVSTDGRFVALVLGQDVYLWERASGKVLDHAHFPKEKVSGVRITSSGRVLVHGWGSNTDVEGHADCLVWELPTRTVIRKATRHLEDSPSAVCGTGRTLALACHDASILLYDLPQPTPRHIRPPTEADCERLWTTLASADAKQAWAVRQRLVESPSVALALLKERLRPAALTSPPAALADLDSDDFATREAAVAKLREALKRGDLLLEMHLRDLLRRKPSLEVVRRAERLLAQVGTLAYSRDELRTIRAVAVLEQIATPDAITLLKQYGAGGTSVLTHEAKAALARLSSR